MKSLGNLSLAQLNVGRVAGLTILVTLVLSALIFGAAPIALAANPAPQQIYFVSLPEDDLLQLFWDNGSQGVTGSTFPSPISPIRSVTSISIGSTGTLVYWDQWEDLSYDADIANPGANVYGPGNLDGTQIWGDGVLSNGCPPSINNVANPCTAASDDLLSSGDVIVLDNLVDVDGSSDSYSRDATEIFFDGRDKMGATFPVAVTRAAWPPTPGSVMAGASEVLDDSRWGTSYEAPVGEDTLDTNTSAFQDVRWFIMAGEGGSTIDVDANGDGDVTDSDDLNNYVMAEGDKVFVDGILMGATLTVVSGNKVQVNSMAADTGDTFEFRWISLVPKADWSNDYYSPVGTRPEPGTNRGCTEIIAYNPNPGTITVNYDFPGGASPDGSFTVAPGVAATGLTVPPSPSVLYNDGARYWTAGSEDFLPISITDCTKDTSDTDGRFFDWGNPLFPANQLTTSALVSYAPGCSGDNPTPLCIDDDVAYPYSRSVVWITPIADTTIFVDYDGSGFTCPAGADADLAISASALTSYRFHDDEYGPLNVLDQFNAVSYDNSDGNVAWAGDWNEIGDDGLPGSGDVQIASGQLNFNNGATTDDRVERSLGDLTAYANAQLSFELGTIDVDATDEIRVEAAPDGSTWSTVAIFTDASTAGKKSYDITSFLGTNTSIRFRMVNTLESGENWNFDAVDVHFGDGNSQEDYDMTGARIGTCDGTEIAAAWGQNPALSGGNDEEALDMGTGIAPFGSDIALVKSADKTVVAQGGLVNYEFDVVNDGDLNLSNIRVTDDRCSPAVYSSGDTNDDGILAPFGAETWIFTCSSNIYFDTTNVAFATGFDGVTDIDSAPDEWTVTVIEPAAIGNYVWLDEDGDGDQDAGEAGIPNVQVNLTGNDDNGDPVSVTTYTDADGGYLFDGLPPSDGLGYTITIVPPSGLNNTYDEDGTTISPDNTTTVVLNPGEEHLTADFGLNWAPSGDTNDPPPGALGAIGDRVWIDADGDGVQDPGEAGLGGVTVSIFHDPEGDGTYTTPFTTAKDANGATLGAGTTTTAPDGSYIFDDLPAGAYVIEVSRPDDYAQTGDPDQFGQSCTACDDQTTTPVVLGPGDVFVNADFGYLPDPGTFGTIGDLVWLDANRNNSQDASEAGIPGVTVSLIRDLDGDGTWDAGEPIIATDITDENGLYEFAGLPIADGTGTDDYLVWVNDTENVLGELAPTYDVRDGVNQGNPSTGVETGLEISAVTDLGVGGAGNVVSDADFAYAPPGHDAGEGLIGDTIWLDRTNLGTYDPGEGLEGVLVTLTDPGPDGILGTGDDTTRDTFTDENGNYYFGSLEPSLDYRITVDPATLPNGGGGLTNTIDPDGGGDSTADVDLSLSANGINLDQDFAYQYQTNPNTIGGTVWVDTNADGTLTALTELGRFEGVTVVLYDSNGNIVATTTTGSDGDYSFTGLPDGAYTVDVTDDDNVLFGYWKSNGPTPNADNNSQFDPYSVSVSGGQTNTTGDFGYYLDPAALGNFVWNDNGNGNAANKGNGIQDVGEPGIEGVVVTLKITWPNGDITTVKTITDIDGFYSFGNLLLDEDYNGSNPPTDGQPVFEISVDTTQSALSNLTPSPTDNGTGATDSNNPAGVNGEVNQGEVNDTYDFGFYDVQLSIGIGYAYAQRNGDGLVDFVWETATETGNAGFNLYMLVDGQQILVTTEMVPSTVIDSVVPVRYTYAANIAGEQYLIEIVKLTGGSERHGPFMVGTEYGSSNASSGGEQKNSIFLPVIVGER